MKSETPCDIRPVEKNCEAASLLLKAMSNEKRLMVLCTLTHGEYSVSELEKIVGLSQSALSQHLARLRRDGLVCTRRDAQTIYYSLNNPAVIELLNALRGIFNEPSAATQNLINTILLNAPLADDLDDHIPEGSA